MTPSRIDSVFRDFTKVLYRVVGRAALKVDYHEGIWSDC